MVEVLVIVVPELKPLVPELPKVVDPVPVPMPVPVADPVPDPVPVADPVVVLVLVPVPVAPEDWKLSKLKVSPLLTKLMISSGLSF